MDEMLTTGQRIVLCVGYETKYFCRFER